MDQSMNCLKMVGKEENMKLYVVTTENEICTVKEMCTCDKCKERGQPEYLLYGLNGQFSGSFNPNDMDHCFITDSLAIALDRVCQNKKSNDFRIKFLEEQLLNESFKND